MQSFPSFDPNVSSLYRSNPSLAKDYSHFFSAYEFLLNAYTSNFMMGKHNLNWNKKPSHPNSTNSTSMCFNYPYFPDMDIRTVKPMAQQSEPEQCSFVRQTLPTKLGHPVLESFQQKPLTLCKPVRNMESSNLGKCHPTSLAYFGQENSLTKSETLWTSPAHKFHPHLTSQVDPPKNPNHAESCVSTIKTSLVHSPNSEEVILMRLAKLPNKLGPYVCRLCHVLFDNAIRLAKHRCPCILHTDYRCPECAKVFNCPANLASHRRWHKPNRSRSTIQTSNQINHSARSNHETKTQTVLSNDKCGHSCLSINQSDSCMTTYYQNDLHSIRQSRDQVLENSQYHHTTALTPNLSLFKSKRSFKSTFTVQSILSDSPKFFDHIE